MKLKAVTRLSKRFLVVTALFMLIAGLSFSIIPLMAENNSKIVYVVFCIDTEMWGGHDLYLGNPNPHPIMDMRAYSRMSPLTVAAVFNESFRDSHRDSFGNIFKMTWFAEMDYLMAQGTYVWEDGSPAGVSGYTAIHDILMNNWGAEIQMYGDSIEYHHHFMIYDGTWKRYDNGPDAGYPEYQMYALDHMIIDQSFYPSVFRSGWTIMPSALSNWLEQWMPFDYTPSSGIWYPTNPSGMDRWQTASASELRQSDVNAAFARARDYGNAIYSLFFHDRDNMAYYVNMLQTHLNTADADERNYPGVSFKYVSAREAMQQALGFTDLTPPTFTVTSSGGTYTIVSSEPLWKNHPYVALKYTDGTYSHVNAVPAGTNTWTVPPQTQITSEENVAGLARPTSLPVAAVTASSFMSGHEPQKAIDGIESTSNYWDSTPAICPQWLQLDLGSVQSFGNIRTHFWDGDGRSYRYYIEVSNDTSVWTMATTEKYVRGVTVDSFSPAMSARYIRIWVTDNTGPNKYAHIIEVGVDVESSGVTASSYDGGHVPDLAIDGIESTSNYWGTNALVPEGRVPQWLKVDLRSPVNISKVTTHFWDGDSRTYTYYIEVSNDGSSWITVVPSKTGRGVVTDTFPEVEVRFVRVTITANTANLAAHIEEIKIYHATAVSSFPPVETIGVAASDLYGNTGVFSPPTPPPPPTTWTLAISSSPFEGGVTNPSGTLQLNDSITVSATPNDQYDFENWQFDGQMYGTTNPITIPTQTLGSIHILVAIFKPQVTPPPPVEENVAVLARPTSLPVAAVTASSFMSGHEPQKAIDGNDATNSYWDSTPGAVPQWLQLDLGSVQSFGNIRTHFWDGDSRNYKYYIEVSNDTSLWTSVVAEKVGQGVMWDYFSSPISARYIRITVTYNSAVISNPANKYAHIIEVGVGVESSGVTASSYDGGHIPDLAIDGIESTSNYWGTNALVPEGRVPQWLKVDLRSPVNISKVTTHFWDGDSRTYTYYIEVSNDGSSWITVVPSKTGRGVVTDTFPEVEARFVRVTITANTANLAAHIEEIKIYHLTSQ